MCYTEQYKTEKNVMKKQADELFTRFRVWECIYSCFEALHSTGVNYIIEDIDLYIEARRQIMLRYCPRKLKKYDILQ